MNFFSIDSEWPVGIRLTLTTWKLMSRNRFQYSISIFTLLTNLLPLSYVSLISSGKIRKLKGLRIQEGWNEFGKETNEEEWWMMNNRGQKLMQYLWSAYYLHNFTCRLSINIANKMKFVSAIQIEQFKILVYFFKIFLFLPFE